MELILASGSASRARILEEAGFTFRIYKTGVKEEPPDTTDLHSYVVRLAIQKATAALKKFSDCLVLAADTMVLNASGKFLGKPASAKQAEKYLHERSDASEEIVTGFCLAHHRQILTGTASSYVFYKKIPQDIRQKILSSGEWKGVCGGLKIEGTIGPYVRRLQGDRNNAMGLPLSDIAPLIKQISQRNGTPQK